MQGGANELPSAGEGVSKSSGAVQTDSGVLEELKPLLSVHGVRMEVLTGAVKEALQEIGRRGSDAELPAEEHRSCLLGLVLWRIFARGSTLWVESKTEAGNPVSLSVRVAAYAMWGNALRFAASRNIDPAFAADTLSLAAQAAADRLADGQEGRQIGGIGDVKRYIFRTYVLMIGDVVAKHGPTHTDSYDIEDWLENCDVSDQGAFLDALEQRVLCGEFMNAMQTRGRRVAIFRHAFGYSWEDTARKLGTSVNAAQKAMSVAIREVAGSCMLELRRVGRRSAAQAEAHLLKVMRRRRRAE